MTTKIRYRPIAGSASGRRTGWAKHVTSVDPDATDGYGVHGDFLRSGQEVELPEGAIILNVRPEGSVKNGWQSAHVLRLERGEDGEARAVSLTEGKVSSGLRYGGALNWRKDFLKARDVLIEALEQEAPSPLAGIPDEELLAELKARMERGLDLRTWMQAVEKLI